MKTTNKATSLICVLYIHVNIETLTYNNIEFLARHPSFANPTELPLQPYYL